MKLLFAQLVLLTMTACVLAQATEPAARGRGRGPRRPTTTPSEILDPDTGQASWLSAVNDVVMQVPGGRGKGVFW